MMIPTIVHPKVMVEHACSPAPTERCLGPLQVTAPAMSFDAPISQLSGHKAGEAPNHEAWGEGVADGAVDGLEDSSLLAKLKQDCVSDLLQHDVNQLLNTLQPRERNVSLRRRLTTDQALVAYAPPQLHACQARKYTCKGLARVEWVFS